MSMGAVPWWHARSRPHELAVVHGEDQVTWLQLAQNATRKAHALREFGVRADDRVTLLLPNGNAFFEAVFAVWMVGATPNPLSPHLPLHELSALVNLAQPKAIIAASGAARELSAQVTGAAVLPDEWESWSTDIDPLAETQAARWKIMASGGSTGRPKLIVDGMPAATDPAVNGLFEFETHRGRLGRPNGVMLNPGPLHHNGPFTFSFVNLLAGSRVVSLRRFDAEETLRQIEKHRVELLYIVPTMMHRIWNLPPEIRNSYDVSSLMGVIHLAAPCPRWLKKSWIDWLGAERIWETYGATEAVTYSLINGTEWLQRPGSVGRFQHGGTCRVLDEHQRELPRGEVGELWLSLRPGAAPPYEYIGATRRSLDTLDSVGDLGWLDADGYLYIADRRTDLILRGGVNVYPAEVEAAIDAHPAVASSAVIGLPDPDLGSRVHAIVELKKDYRLQVGPNDLRAFLHGRLAGYKLPSSIEFTDSTLRDTSGKVNRSTLRASRVASAEE